MNYFSTYTDNIDRRGFISKESLLSLVSEEEIFKIVFGYLPEEFRYVRSPLRHDKTPGCWFTRHVNGILYFVDFGHSRTHSDCFNVVQDYFDIPNFYLTLKFIQDKLLSGIDVSTLKVKNIHISDQKQKSGVKLLIEARNFAPQDGYFWSKYEISRQNLMEDKVFPVSKFYALNTKNGSIVSDVYDLCYSYNDFSEGKKKLYFPEREGRRRFLTNCGRNDVGGLNSISPLGKTLIISKSYKDYRVLKNNGKNVVWFQNEGMIPDRGLFEKFISEYKEIIVWFDNDETGIKASEKIKNHINAICPCKAKNLWLPEKALNLGIKDPSDCIAEDKQLFHHFLKSFVK